MSPFPPNPVASDSPLSFPVCPALQYHFRPTDTLNAFMKRELEHSCIRVYEMLGCQRLGESFAQASSEALSYLCCMLCETGPLLPVALSPRLTQGGC